MTVNKRKAAALGAAGVAVATALVLVLNQPGRPAASDSAAAGATTADAAHAGKTDPRTRKTGDKPYWRTLSPAQQRALQPLQAEWDGMDGVRKQKWLQLANRFGAMNPQEQQRVHERMRAWVKLTPEQRELARETYSRTRKIAPDQKTATWESYQLLPDDQKRKLAASSTRKAPATPPAKASAPLGQGATACPAGTVKNSASATPPCVPPPPVPAVAPPVAPPAATPPAPTPPAQQEKPVPANWGISPNNA